MAILTGNDEWLAAIDAEVEAMVHCVCKWPNFAPGVCMLCGRKENLGKEAQKTNVNKVCE